MKKKLISIVLMIMTIIFLTNNVLAANTYTINVNVSTTSAKPGNEINVDLSTSAINNGITGMAFTLEYNASLLDYVSITATNDWDINKTENLFTIESKNSETITTTGKVCTIKLKVKDNVSATTTEIKIKKLQLSDENASLIELNDIVKEINIVSQEQHENEKEKIISGGQNEIPVVTNEKEDKTSKVISEKTNDKSETDKSTKKTENKANTNNSKASKASKLPYTGRTITGMGIILVTILVAILLYEKYKTYKNI